MPRRILLVPLIAAFVSVSSPTEAQLSGKVAEMIRFGTCDAALCLQTGTGNHQTHFLGAAATASGDLLQFISGSITSSIGRLPISSTSGGSYFTFVGGAPVLTNTSAGPIFAERGTTLGRGRILAGASTTRIAFNELRGVPTDSLLINLSHDDVGAPGLGDSPFESDVIGMHLDIGLKLQVTTLFATYGVSDKVDVSVALPLVYSSLDGTGHATIYNVTGTVTGAHHFGTPESPLFTAQSNVSGSAMGLGDIALRLKAQVAGTQDRALGLMADVRLPSGNEEEFHGSGSLSASARVVASARRGDFSPHANLGFAMRGGKNENNAMLLTLGFDHSLNRAATVAVDLLSEFQMRGDAGTLPQSIVLPARTISGTNIPLEKDNPMALSFGGRFLIKDYTLITNALVPVKSGGMQAKFAWTLGIERTF